MGNKNQHYRHIMLYYFRKGKSATKTAKKIVDVYGEPAVTVRAVQHWFARFRSGDFELGDRGRSGRPVITDTATIKTIVNENAHLTLREIADIVGVSYTTVERHLRIEGYVNRGHVWVQEDLNESKTDTASWTPAKNSINETDSDNTVKKRVLPDKNDGEVSKAKKNKK